MKYIPLHVATFVCLLSPSLLRAHPCELDVFTPGSLALEIQSSLREASIAPISEAEGARLGITVASGTRALLSSGAVVGKLVQSGSRRFGNSQVSVFDDTGRPLFSASLVQFACPSHYAGGPCFRIEITTEFEPPVEGHLAFSVLSEGTLPSVVARYYKYGHQVGRRTFAAGLRASLDWLTETLLERRQSLPFKAIAPLEQAFLNLFSDPDVAPYLSAISFADERGRLVIRGRVPSNYVHGRIVDAFHKAGLWNVQPWITIDTGMILLSDQGPSLRACGF